MCVCGLAHVCEWSCVCVCVLKLGQTKHGKKGTGHSMLQWYEPNTHGVSRQNQTTPPPNSSLHLDTNSQVPVMSGVPKRRRQDGMPSVCVCACVCVCVRCGERLRPGAY